MPLQGKFIVGTANPTVRANTSFSERYYESVAGSPPGTWSNGYMPRRAKLAQAVSQLLIPAVEAGPADQELTPASIVVTRAFGAAVVATGNVNVAPASIVRTRAFGTAVITVFIHPASIVRVRSFGTAVITTGNVNVSPASIVRTRAFGVAVVSGDTTVITVPSIVRSRAFGVHTVSPGGVVVAPASIERIRIFGNTTVAGEGAAPTPVFQFYYTTVAWLFGRPEYKDRVRE